MKILLDHCVARLLGQWLTGHEVRTAQECGLADIGNGKLLRAAADSGFDVLLSLDKGLQFQQNLRTLPIAVLLVRSGSSDLEAVRELLPAILAALQEMQDADLSLLPTKPLVVIPPAN